MNRVVIHLQEAEEDGKLIVQLETETPNLNGFEIRLDEGDWESQEDPAFEWTLQESGNRLEARPVNAFGRRGSESWVEVAQS